MGPGLPISEQEPWLSTILVPKEYISCLWKGMRPQRLLQLSHGKHRVASPAGKGERNFWLSLHWESGRLFLAPGGRVLLLIYLSSYFWTGVGKRLFLVRWWVVFL